MQTQWHIGVNGETGLIYVSLYPLLDRRFSAGEWDAAFADIRCMEVAALNAMRSK